MSKIIKLRLILDVDYEIPDGTPEEQRQHAKDMAARLDELPSKIAGDGLLTGDSDVVVDTWDHRVHTRELTDPTSGISYTDKG